MGRSTMRVDSRAAVDDLKGVVDDHPTSMFARVLYADTLAICAEDKGDLKYIDRAMKYADLARRVLPDSPFMLSIDLKVHTIAVALGNKEERETDTIRANADALAKELETRFPSYVQGRYARASYFTVLDRLEEAEAEWRVVLDLGGGFLAEDTYVAVLLRLQHFDKALEDEDFQCCVYALMDDREAALRAFDRVTAGAAPILQLWDRAIGKFCGQSALATPTWKALQNSTESQLWWIDRPLRLFLEEATPQEVLDEAGDVNQQVAHAHYSIARNYLVEGERKLAMQHCRACVECNAVTYDTHQWALVFLTHMERNPDWPASLKPKSDRQTIVAIVLAGVVNDKDSGP